MLTLKDISKKTGLSIATVSKHINGIKINSKNAVIIDNVIKELDYKINPIARSLKKNQSMTVGVLIHEFENIFAASIISTIENILGKKDYGTIICDYKSDKETEKQKLSFLMNKMVDALVILPTYLTNEDLEKIKIPLVIIDRKIEGENIDCVLTNNYEAGKAATGYLIENGHENIAIISGPEYVYTAKERLKGYKAALKENKIEKTFVFFGNNDIETGTKCTYEILKNKKITAVFATNYEMTLGAIIALNEKNINIPLDISIIGYDNMHMAKIVKPSLSIITQPIEEIGERAANILIQRLEKNDISFKKTDLKSQLVKGGSVRCIS